MEQAKSEYEETHGLVSRYELMGYVNDFLDGLTDREFHAIYHIIWTLNVNRTLLKSGDREIPKKLTEV